MSQAMPAGQTPTRLDMRVRKAIGWIAVLLPFLLFFGNLAHANHHPLAPYSISGYYYTHWRNLFCLALGAISFLLIVYTGDDDADRWLTNVAGLLVIGLVFCPTTPTRPPFYHGPTLPDNVQRLYGVLHMTFAVILFLLLALLALRFARVGTGSGGGPAREIRRLARELWYSPPAPGDARSLRRRRRDAACRACARLILISMALAGLSKLAPHSATGHAVLILEAIAVVCFGLSWLVNGQAILPDPG